MSDLMLDVDQAGELKAAFRRGNWSNAEIKRLCEGDVLVQVRQVLIGCAEIVECEKFTLLADLGTITVPDDYDHATRLAVFREQNRDKFWGYNDNFTDANFPNPTRVLKPGDQLHVLAFKQAVGGTTTSEERMDFLHRQKAVFTSAQGASLVWEQKRDKLPKGYWYLSFDEKDRLWKDADGVHRVPWVSVYSDGVFDWSLGRFEGVWGGIGAILCFRDLPAGGGKSSGT